MIPSPSWGGQTAKRSGGECRPPQNANGLAVRRSPEFPSLPMLRIGFPPHKGEGRLGREGEGGGGQGQGAGDGGGEGEAGGGAGEPEQVQFHARAPRASMRSTASAKASSRSPAGS